MKATCPLTNNYQYRFLPHDLDKLPSFVAGNTSNPASPLSLSVYVYVYNYCTNTYIERLSRPDIIKKEIKSYGAELMIKF